MKQASSIILFFFSLTLAHNVMAVKVMQCEDEQGNITYQNNCSPGTKPVGRKDYNIKTATAATASISGPLTLYIVPDCDSCEQVKEFLQVRNISVSEKNVNDDYALQEELKGLAGDLRVPVLIVNDEVIVGYNRTELLEALKAAGYKED